MFQGKQKEISGGAKNTTNNIMEITAVIEALKLLKLNGMSNAYRILERAK